MSLLEDVSEKDIGCKLGEHEILQSRHMLDKILLDAFRAFRTNASESTPSLGKS